MAVRELFNLIAGLAAARGGMPQLKTTASRYFCQSARCAGRRVALVKSVTGARYCPPLRVVREEGRKTMTDCVDPPIDTTLKSEHFTLYRDNNAFGETLTHNRYKYLSVMLIQPTNEWFQKQWSPSLAAMNERNILVMLEQAYQKGCADTRAEIKKALGFK